jgi:hypothetical protein
MDLEHGSSTHYIPALQPLGPVARVGVKRVNLNSIRFRLIFHLGLGECYGMSECSAVKKRPVAGSCWQLEQCTAFHIF